MKVSKYHQLGSVSEAQEREKIRAIGKQYGITDEKWVSRILEGQLE